MDSELVPGTFLRIDHRELGLPTAALWARRDMLTERHGVRALGFLDLGTTTGPTEWPEITTVVADMRSEYQVNLVIPTPELGQHATVPLVEAHFEDPHPVWWSDAAHRDGRLIVLTGSRAVEEYSNIQAFLLTCWVGVIPLALYAFDTGTGTRRPPSP